MNGEQESWQISAPVPTSKLGAALKTTAAV
jgi:hypothetical protein